MIERLGMVPTLSENSLIDKKRLTTKMTTETAKSKSYYVSCVHCMCVTHALCVHYACVTCALCVHYVCIVCALHVCCVCIMHALCVQLCIMHALHVHCVRSVCVARISDFIGRTLAKNPCKC